MELADILEAVPSRNGPIAALIVDPRPHLLDTGLLSSHLDLGARTIAAVYKDRWQIGVPSQGRITQPVEVRPRLKNPRAS
jgi:hypothetical protein